MDVTLTIDAELQDLVGYFAALALTIPLLTLLSASLLRKQEI